ncbi:tRNA-U16,U17-dihydrouridine synthase [Limimonas halophila]|uniref:tRNA-dihydrouridine(20/20a) synthase n=1 Tax=Limimonas halophila TaxID=1082479 RepID=A0A1G7PQY6_9PROT|nr:tRNA dihydrouridine(20/20a) synthase DusA [Limimonas halophila]SDF88653.1 tRNA-U16,U17-dihydrouridine synthase [Limimonas halophila]
MAVRPDETHAQPLDRRLAVAPMMQCTDRHCRAFHRLLTRRTLLYTEMVTANAVLHGERDKLLGFSPAEHPVALQLGGADPDALAQSAAIAEARGYDEVNLNVGCPSDRVQNATFGACLMARPELVADCVAAMRAAVSRIPVTVKTRIGIDDSDDDAFLRHFVDTVAERGGCSVFIIHARKAWLQGLSPKENREKPPLNHARVHRLKRERPELEILTNGGIQDLDGVEEQLNHVDGVMLGRAAYDHPWLLADADRRIYGETNPVADREAAIDGLIAHARELHAAGTPVRAVTRHALGLCSGLPGARHWRRHLSEAARRDDAPPEVIAEAFARVRTGVRMAA